MENDAMADRRYQESIRATLTRTVTIAVVAGCLASRGVLARWPAAALVMMWPAFGGHWVEVLYLNWLRPLLPRGAVRVAVRLAVWFAGGMALAFVMSITAKALGVFGRVPVPGWWLGGLVFIGIEFVAHVVLQLRGRPSFLNQRG